MIARLKTLAAVLACAVEGHQMRWDNVGPFWRGSCRRCPHVIAGSGNRP